MEYLDPIEIEHLAQIEKKRQRSAIKRTQLINLAYITLSALCLLAIVPARKLPNVPFNIIMPVVVILLPSLLMTCYPSTFRQDSPVHKRPFLLLRVNYVGALILSLAINQFYMLSAGWREAMFASMVICYILSTILALMPFFGDGIKPLAIWTASEYILKSITLALLALIVGHAWGILFPPDMYIGYKAWAIRVFAPLAGITVFIPFYLGLAVSNIPHADKSRTSGFDNKKLIARFGDENMPGMP